MVGEMHLSTYAKKVCTINEGIKKNNIDIVREAFDKGDIMVNDANYIQDTSLGMAIEYNCSEQLIDFLIRKGI